MKRIAGILLLFLAAPAAAEPISWPALLDMARSGRTDEQIRVEVSREGLSFDLGVDQVRDLLATGRTPTAVRAIVRTANRAADAGDPALIPGDAGEAPEPVIPDAGPLPAGAAPLDAARCLPPGFTWPKASDLAASLTVASVELSAAESTTSVGMMPLASSHRVASAGTLSRAGLHTAACAVVRKAVSLAPGPEEYACALQAWNAVRRQVPCPSAEPATLAAVHLAGLPSASMALHLLLVGSDLLSGPDAAIGRALLARIPPGTREYPEARLLLGLDLLEARRFRSATRLLLQAVQAGRAVGDAPEVVDRGLVLLGRIAFENSLFDTAAFHYQQVEPASAWWPRAAYELSWSHLMAGRGGTALGSLFALTRMGLATPEAVVDGALIRATAYVHSCLYPIARIVADQGLRDLDAVDGRLKRFQPVLGEAGAPCDAACVSDREGRVDPVEVLGAFPGLTRDPDFRRTWNAFKIGQVEFAMVRDAVKGVPAAGAVLEPLATWTADLRARAGRASYRELARIRDTAAWTRARIIELQVDIDSEEKESLTKRVQELDETKGRSYREILLKEVAELARRGLTSAEIVDYIETNVQGGTLNERDLDELRFAGLPADTVHELRKRFGPHDSPEVAMDPAGVDNRIVWDFRSEVWADEIDGLRIVLPDACGVK